MENGTRTSTLLLLLMLFFLCFTNQLEAQTKSRHSFSKLESAEKRWVLAHPFIAKKAYRATQRARVVTDSLFRNGILKDGNGGQLDAFRHAYWMALLVQSISEKKAEKLGEAHEKGNYKSWKKGLLEDSLRADSILCIMDLQNNATGIKIGKQYLADTSLQKKSLEALVLENVKKGKMVIVKKNAMRQPTDASGRIIVPEHYKSKWYMPKVLVNSDYREPPAG